MSEDAEIYERLNMAERTLDRYDERLKSLEDFSRDARDILRKMGIQLAGIVAVATLLVQVLFHIWK